MATRYQETFDLIGKRPKARNERGAWVRRGPRKRSKHFDGALDLLTDGSVGQHERWRAIRALIVTIWWIQNGFSDPAEPPRTSELRRMLRETRDAAGLLQRKALHLSTPLTEYGQLFLPSRLVEPELYASLESSMLLGARAEPEQNVSRLYEALIALQKFCRLLDKQLPSDRGGQTNILTGKFPNPKARLATEAGRLLSEWRLEDVQGTEGGPFYMFCAELYALITKERPEEFKVGLRRYVEFAAPRIRNIHKLSERWQHLQQQTGFRRPSNKEAFEINRLWTEMRALHDELAAGPLGRAQR